MSASVAGTILRGMMGRFRALEKARMMGVETERDAMERSNCTTGLSLYSVT